MVVVHEIDACGTIFTLSDAVVNISGTRRTTPTVQTRTRKCTRRIFAKRRIDAWTQIRRWIRFAFIYVCAARERERERERRWNRKIIIIHSLYCRKSNYPQRHSQAIHAWFGLIYFTYQLGTHHPTIRADIRNESHQLGQCRCHRARKDLPSTHRCLQMKFEVFISQA